MCEGDGSTCAELQREISGGARLNGRVGRLEFQVTNIPQNPVYVWYEFLSIFEHFVGEYISRYPMHLNAVSKMVDSDACPRPTAQAVQQRRVAEGAGGAVSSITCPGHPGRLSALSVNPM